MDLRKAIVLSRSKEGPAPIMTHLEALLSSDSFDLHLQTHTSHKDILEAHLWPPIATFCPWDCTLALPCEATSNHCPSLNTRGRHCSVADEKPLRRGPRYARPSTMEQGNPKITPPSYLCAFSPRLCTSRSHPPRQSDCRPRLHLPHLRPRPDS